MIYQAKLNQSIEIKQFHYNFIIYETFFSTHLFKKILNETVNNSQFYIKQEIKQLKKIKYMRIFLFSLLSFKSIIGKLESFA